MYTKEITNHIQYLREEYLRLSEGNNVFINYNLKYTEVVKVYYKSSLQEEFYFDKNCYLDYTKLYEQKQLQYEEQVKSHREIFQARIKLFEDYCKEIAQEIGKDFESFLKEDIKMEL